MSGRRSLCGGKRAKRLQSIFVSTPTLLKKKVLLIFSGKGGPDTAFKKFFKSRKNPKHYDDLNRAMRTGGQKLCANEMHNFALNSNKEIPTKNVTISMILLFAVRNTILESHHAYTLRFYSALR